MSLKRCGTCRPVRSWLAVQLDIRSFSASCSGYPSAGYPLSSAPVASPIAIVAIAITGESLWITSDTPSDMSSGLLAVAGDTLGDTP